MYKTRRYAINSRLTLKCLNKSLALESSSLSSSLTSLHFTIRYKLEWTFGNQWHVRINNKMKTAYVLTTAGFGFLEGGAFGANLTCYAIIKKIR